MSSSAEGHRAAQVPRAFRKSAAKSSITKQSETKRDGRVGTKHELMIGVQTLWRWRKNREHPPAAPPSHQRASSTRHGEEPARPP
jgi:ribosome assembly protein YihI (activator of Der GTPase)